jgi:hypothetical protein
MKRFFRRNHAKILSAFLPGRVPAVLPNVVLLAALVISASLTACSSKQQPESQQEAAPTAPTATIDPSTVGTITGTVTLNGAPPEAHPIIMSAAPECAKLHASPPTYPEVVVGDNGALADVAVYVKSGLGNYRFDTPAAPAVLDQAGCMYEPHVLGLMVHQTLRVQNTDSIEHNVHPVPHQNKAWNKSQPIGGGPIDSSFDHPELAIRVLCNLHPWMRAYLFVFSHPYFDVTSKSGAFALKNLPPGTYTIEAWQEKYGTQDHTVTLAPHQSAQISFTFQSAQK